MASYCDIIILLPKYVSIVLSHLPFLELEKKKKKKSFLHFYSKILQSSWGNIDDDDDFCFFKCHLTCWLSFWLLTFNLICIKKSNTNISKQYTRIIMSAQISLATHFSIFICKSFYPSEDNSNCGWFNGKQSSPSYLESSNGTNELDLNSIKMLP